MKEIGTLIFLAVNSWKDWKYREISLVLTGIYGVVGVGYSFWQSRSLYDFMIPAAIAALFLILSVVTAGEIGLGDGWILLALGQMLYLWKHHFEGSDNYDLHLFYILPAPYHPPISATISEAAFVFRIHFAG